MAGKINSSYSLTLVWDFIGIVNKDERHAEPDLQGETTLQCLKNCRKVAQRVNSVHLSSLGLHPVVYLYAQNGRHKPASFYAIVDLMLALERLPNGFVRFSKVGENMEALLIAHDYIIQQIVRHHRSALASYPAITKFYEACIEKLSKGKSTATAVEEIIGTEDFKFVTSSTMPQPSTPSVNFSSETKSATFIREALRGAPKCKICHGYLHTSSITTDHIVDKAKGGTANEDNAQLAHPYCNSTLKAILASECQQPTA